MKNNAKRTITLFRIIDNSAGVKTKPGTDATTQGEVNKKITQTEKEIEVPKM